MNPTTAQQVFKDLAKDKWHPFYVIVGEEPFQRDEFRVRLKAHFIKGEGEGDYNCEEFSGEGLDAGALVAALETLPGLFDTEGGSTRLVICQQFEKVSASNLEKLQPYLLNPSPSTCFLIACQKADKRKAWYKAVKKKGAIVEVREPYDREWPRWQGYFEKKVGKTIDAQAWQILLDYTNRTLSIIWTELQKIATFVGTKKQIGAEDVGPFVSGSGADNVFGFVDDVMNRDQHAATKKYLNLLDSGENEIKLSALIIRQFRIQLQYMRLSQQGVRDNRTLASEIGINPYFLSKLLQQERKHTLESLKNDLVQLSECDFKLKTGSGRLFEDFLVPYFG